jgi:hypothetical protein
LSKVRSCIAYRCGYTGDSDPAFLLVRPAYKKISGGIVCLATALFLALLNSGLPINVFVLKISSVKKEA